MSTVALLCRCCSDAADCRPALSGGQRLRRASASPGPADPSDLAGILGQVLCCGQRPKPELGQLLGAVSGHPLCAVAELAHQPSIFGIAARSTPQTRGSADRGRRSLRRREPIGSTRRRSNKRPPRWSCCAAGEVRNAGAFSQTFLDMRTLPNLLT
jgi:hypothetical protein